MITDYNNGMDALQLELFTRGVVCVYYFTRLIAVVDGAGRIQWRDMRYPVYLIEYLLTLPTAEDAKRN